MKNAIIATLSLALLFFVLQSLGAFDAGDPIDRNYRAHFARERESQVERAGEWLFGFTHAPGSEISVDTVAGMHFEADRLNAQGGVLGRPVRLEGRAARRMPKSQNRAIQRFCDNFAAAACFAPFYSSGVPSVRALSQFQGLPIISPLTLQDPRLPRLEPDNYAPLLPPISVWIGTITARLKKLEPRRVLIVGPNETASYGEFFSNASELSVRRDLPEAEIYRYNYDVNIGDGEGFRQIVDLYKENRGLDAVIYSGGWEMLPLLNEALKMAGLNVPVFGSDLLHVRVAEDEEAGQAESRLVPPVNAVPGNVAIDFPLYVPVLVTKSMEGDFGRAWREKHGAAPSFWNFMGAMAVRLTCEALEQEGGYNTEALPRRVRELVLQLWSEEVPKVRLHVLGKRPEKAATGKDAGVDAAKLPQVPDALGETDRQSPMGAPGVDAAARRQANVD